MDDIIGGIFFTFIAIVSVVALYFLVAMLPYDPQWKAIEAEKQGEVAIINAQSEAAHQRTVDAAFTARSEAELQVYEATEALKLREAELIQPTRVQVQVVLLWSIPLLIVIFVAIIGVIVWRLVKRDKQPQTRIVQIAAPPERKEIAAPIEIEIPARLSGVSRRKQLEAVRQKALSDGEK